LFYRRDVRQLDCIMIDSRLKSDLGSALERGELFAYYQPQQDLATGRIVSVEALCRWQHPVLGLLSPGLFIPLAEEVGVIHDIGLFMLEESFAAASAWRRSGVNLEVSVNVSATQLATDAFADRVILAATEAALPPRTITVEITESVPILELQPVLKRLNLLRESGVGVSIDDYGTGHTSAAQLHELPVTELKLDQSLVQTESDALVAELKQLVSSVHERDIRVVAEGVETFVDLDRCRLLGCDRVQGYLIGMPMAREDLEVLLARSGRR